MCKTLTKRKRHKKVHSLNHYAPQKGTKCITVRGQRHGRIFVVPRSETIKNKYTKNPRFFLAPRQRSLRTKCVVISIHFFKHFSSRQAMTYAPILGINTIVRGGATNPSDQIFYFRSKKLRNLYLVPCFTDRAT